MCEHAVYVLGNFSFKLGGRGYGALSLLGGVVEIEAEEGGGWWVRKVISWDGGGYLARDTPAVEF